MLMLTNAAFIDQKYSKNSNSMKWNYYNNNKKNFLTPKPLKDSVYT